MLNPFFRKFIKSLEVIFLVGFLGSSIFCITAQANVTIVPYNSDRSNKIEKDWFVFSAKAGQTIKDSLILDSSDKSDIEASISAKDAIVTSEGNFTILDDLDQNKEVGNWLKLEVNKILIPQTGSTKIPFQIDIPKDTKDGEYAAGFAVTTLKPSQDAVKIAIRKGVRTYIAVGQDFKLNTKIQNLNILDPQDPNYTQIKKDKPYFGKENLLLEFQAQNNGNIFGVLDCKYALKYSDGTNYENVFSTEIAPRNEGLKYYIITNEPYKTGKTEAILDCQTKSQNIDSKKVKIENEKAALSDDLELDQAQIDAFESSKNPAFVKPNLGEDKIENTKDDTKTKADMQVNQDQNNGFDVKYIIGGFLILIIAAGSVFYYIRKRKVR